MASLAVVFNMWRYLKGIVLMYEYIGSVYTIMTPHLELILSKQMHMNTLLELTFSILIKYMI